MFKKTLMLFTLATCGIVSLQAVDTTSDQPNDKNQELSCNCKGGCNRKHAVSFEEEEEAALAGCAKCRNRHFV